MVAGLPTSLHLAASLLALVAAAGVAVAAVAGSRSGLRWLIALGAVVVAVGHGVGGALLAPDPAVPALLRAVGFVIIAVGLISPGGAAAAGPAIVVPLPPEGAATVAAVAAALGGLRAVLAGRRRFLLGAGLGLWAVAEVLAHSPTAAAVATVAGSLAIAAWLWQVSATRLAARLVAASVISILAVVLLIAGVLGGLGATDLVEEELDRLEGFADLLATEVSVEWPADAIAAARPLATSGAQLLNLDPSNAQQLDSIYSLSFRQQDFYLVLDEAGEIRVAYSPDPEVIGGAFQLQIAGTVLVDNLLQGSLDTEAGTLLTVGGRIVALGGVPLQTPETTVEEGPAGALITGSILDENWVALAADELGVELVVGVDGQPDVVVSDLGEPAGAAVTRLGVASRGLVDLGPAARYAAASPITPPGSDAPLGSIVAMSTTDVLASLEVAQVRRLFLIALVGLAVAVALSAALAHRLVAPIRRLTSAAAAVREGDLEATADVDSPDEVGQLGRTFDEMTTSLAAQSTLLREAADVESRLRARLESLTESMSDALIAVGSDDRVLTFNPAAERLTGWEVADVIGRPLGQVLHGRAADDSVAEALQPADPRATVARQVLLERRDGSVVPAAVTSAPVLDADHRLIGRVLVLRDVRREAEVERMKTEFLSNVSHELRTPLTPIKGYAEVLARRDVGADATRKFASQILSSTARLERIVATIVDFAALDSGRLRLSREPTDLSSLVSEALDEWRERHPERAFRRRIASGLPPVLVDRRMLRRCLDELLDNAVKFSPEGKAISVSAVLSEDGERVVLTVRDRGVGMEEAAAAEVFRDFHQVDASETRHFGGLGLGLALVRRIVDASGGTASVESAPGEGTSVHLELPCADEPPGGPSGNGRSATHHRAPSASAG